MDYLEAEPSPSLSNGTLPSSSSSVASRLYLNGRLNSRRNSFNSEPELMQFNDRDSISTDFGNATNQMSILAQKLNELQEEKMMVNEEKSRLRTDNAILQERVHLLEEHLHATEQRWTEKYDEERAKSRELAHRMERERQLEAERESLKHQMLSNEVAQSEREKDRMAGELKEARGRLEKLQEQLVEAQQEAEKEQTEHRQLRREFDSYRREMSNRLEDNSVFLEELARQADELRQSGLDSVPRQGSLTDKIIQLEEEVERLSMDNRELQEQCTDLQAQLLHNSVECGKNLLADAGQPSLAAELSGTGMDHRRMLDIIKEQDIDNQKLRNYINGILMRQLAGDVVYERRPAEDLERRATSQPVSPSSSSVFARNALERFSLRQPTSSCHRQTASPTPQQQQQQSNFVSRLYNSIWSPQWALFRRKEETSAEGNGADNAEIGRVPEDPTPSAGESDVNKSKDQTPSD
uniref:FIP-RBD domain-containing protein n=1 Tax=Globodera rostochiensis TaxID=31243 RepID=A0A914HQ70_GLORO